MGAETLIWIFLFGMLLIGVPIYVALGASTLFVLLSSDIPLNIVPLDLYKVAEMFPLLAVPLFILAGSLMEKGGMAKQIVDFALMLVGRIRGGLGIVTIIGCVFFAAMIGSGPATVAAMGSLMIPSMVRNGYSIDYGIGVTSTGGTLGILIPPSNPMILYGVIANLSIAKIFMAGFIPGAIVACVLTLVAYIIARRAGYTGSTEKYTPKEVLQGFLKNIWSIFAPIIILGGIYTGIFTPVEASVVAVVYALFVGLLITKELDFKKIVESLNLTNHTTAIMVIVVGVSSLFGRFLTLYQVPQKLAGLLLSITDSPQIVLALILLMLFVLGMFMDTLATIVILGPILVPVVTQFGIDPIFFGILWVMANEVALLTPPLGPNVFIAMSLTGISLERASKSVIPYTLALIVTIFFIMFFGEGLVMFLPRVLGN